MGENIENEMDASGAVSILPVEMCPQTTATYLKQRLWRCESFVHNPHPQSNLNTHIHHTVRLYTCY